MHKDRELLPIMNALAVFEVVGRSLSFTGAANLLGMAQPSVSRFVAKLEDHVGIELVRRDHKRIALTSAGQKLFGATTRGLDPIRAVLSEFRDEKGDQRLSIGCTIGFAHMWLMPRLSSLRALLPGFDIRASLVDGTETSTDYSDQLTVRFGDGNWAGQTSFLLFEEDVFPVCTPDFARRHSIDRENVTALELSRVPLLACVDAAPGWLDWAAWFAHFGVVDVSPPTPESTNDYIFLLQASMEGRGVTLAWRNLIGPHLENGSLTSPGSLSVRTGRGYFLTCDENAPFKEGLQTWLDEMR